MNSSRSMEPTIKYENCDDVYGENLDEMSTMNEIPSSNHYYGNDHQLHPPQQPQQTSLHPNSMGGVKRNFEQMQQNGTATTSMNQSGLSGNYNPSTGNNNNSHADHHTSYFSPHGGYGGVPSHPPVPEYDMFHHLNARVDMYNTATQADGGKPLKKYKRGESSLLFNPPFFKLLEGFSSPHHKDAIAARCYACGKVVRGNKSISSNFIKHMKRGHPEINKIYDSYKIYRIRTGIMPHLSQIMDGKMDMKFDKDDSCGVINDSNDENGPYIEATAILDSSEIGEDEKHSENSEINDDDSVGVVNNVHQASRESRVDNEVNNKTEFQKQISATDVKDEQPSDKLMEVIDKMMDDKLREYVKRADIQQLIGTLTKLNAHNNDNIIQQENTLKLEENPMLIELKKEMEHLKQECSTLRLAVQQSQASKRQLQNELQTMDKLLYQRKLIVRNLNVSDPENPQKAVQKFFKETLGLDEIKVLNCSIIPSTKSVADSNRKCIGIELENHRDTKIVLRQIPKLKDTGIFIEPEISPTQRQRKDKLMILRKELLRRKPDLKVLVRNTTLVVNGQQFYWDCVEGLCHDANKEALQLNAIEYLKTLTTLDLKEFIEILQNYDIQIR